jgi:eukaryotic-like serine/threonine-protein kinase
VTHERWHRVVALFHDAASRSGSERSAFLAAACDGDEALRQDVESLLEHERSVEGFLEDPPLSSVIAALGGASNATTTAVAPDEESMLSTAFGVGALIDERFRIARQVGEGGMAVVYEAVDEKLQERIAIKRPKVGFNRRLPPEVRYALRVTHTNVCRTHAIHVARMPQGDLDFLTMEFLEGETLADKIRREGPFDGRAARDVALQICAGLEEAHRRGVIHRDLKCRNIVITITATSQLRAVITDFGLARQIPVGGALLNRSAVIDATGPCGTPPYMAPELWRGEPASEASDIYALGVILYEMIAGHRPFGDAGPLDAAPRERRRAALRVPPGCPAGWLPIIRRCLEARPSHRFRTAGEVTRALHRAASGRGTWVAAALGLTVVLGGGFAVDPSWRSDVRATRLAIGNFEIDPALDAMGRRMVAEVSERLNGLPGKNRLLVMPVSAATPGHARTALDARAVAGATHILYGSLDKRGQKISVNATIAETATQLKVGQLSADYDSHEFGNLARAVVGTVTAALRLPAVIPEPIASSAYPQYAEGVSYLRRGDLPNVDRALRHFEAAGRLDADSALPLAGMALAALEEFRLTNAPFWRDRARNSIEKANARNPDAAAAHIAAGLLEQADGRHDRAGDHFQRAIELEPGNADPRRYLAAVYQATNRPDEALVAYNGAIEAEPGYYKPYLDLGLLHFVQARYEDAAAAFRKVTSLAPDLALGHTNLAGCYISLGRYDDAEAEYRKALQLKESEEGLENLALVLVFAHREAEAIELYKRALAIPPPHFRLWMNIGDSFRRTGRSKEARHAYLQGEALAEHDLRENPRDGYARAFAAYFYARLGEPKRALLEIEQALRLSPSDARVTRRAAILYDALGHRDDAIRVLSAAPATLLLELSRHPDLVDLSRDPRFQALRSKADAPPH